MFDHIALGIVLPGPITPVERRLWRKITLRRTAWKRSTGYEAGNNAFGVDCLDPDFDDPPIFTLAEPEMPHPPGADQ